MTIPPTEGTEGSFAHKLIIPIIIFISILALATLYIIKPRLPAEFNDSQSYTQFSKNGISFEYPTDWQIDERWGNCEGSSCSWPDTVQLKVFPKNANIEDIYKYDHVTIGIGPTSEKSINLLKSAPSSKITVANRQGESYNDLVMVQLDKKYYFYIKYVKAGLISKNTNAYKKIINSFQSSITTAQLDAMYKSPDIPLRDTPRTTPASSAIDNSPKVIIPDLVTHGEDNNSNLKRYEGYKRSYSINPANTLDPRSNTSSNITDYNYLFLVKPGEESNDNAITTDFAIAWDTKIYIDTKEVTHANAESELGKATVSSTIVYYTTFTPTGGSPLNIAYSIYARNVAK